MNFNFWRYSAANIQNKSIVRDTMVDLALLVPQRVKSL